MTLNERCKQFRSEARRYKRKYLGLKMNLKKMFKEIVESSYDVKHYNDSLEIVTDTVVDINDVTNIMVKYVKEIIRQEREEREWEQ